MTVNTGKATRFVGSSVCFDPSLWYCWWIHRSASLLLWSISHDLFDKNHHNYNPQLLLPYIPWLNFPLLFCMTDKMTHYWTQQLWPLASLNLRRILGRYFSRYRSCLALKAPRLFLKKTPNTKQMFTWVKLKSTKGLNTQVLPWFSEVNSNVVGQNALVLILKLVQIQLITICVHHLCHCKHMKKIWILVFSIF